MTRIWIVAALASGAFAQSADLASFDQVWTTIRDTHWQKDAPGGLDWNAVRAEFRPRVANASSTEEARTAMQEMLRRLKQTHFGVIGGYAPSDDEPGGSGTPGIDLRVLDGEVVVTSVDPGSPAERGGVRPGWAIRAVNGRSIVIPALSELQQTRALLRRLSGPVGGSITVAFDRATLDLGLTTARGELAQFGNLPASRVFYEERRFGATAYVRFNEFLDIPRIIPAFDRTLKGCTPCAGLILDLRGNPGGIAGLAMGLAGFLVDKPNQRLGTMYLRDATLNFVVNPRPPVFAGKVAILLDGTSASTSEILAGGLQDLGRAKVFGTRSAAAALPSIITTLPNGDAFQYAIAGYVSQSGNALEGAGVTPDVEVKLTRQTLLAGHDAVIDAALEWIGKP